MKKKKDTLYRIRFKNGWYYPQRYFLKLWIEVCDNAIFGFRTFMEAKQAIINREKRKYRKNVLWKSQNGIHAEFTDSELWKSIRKECHDDNR